MDEYVLLWILAGFKTSALALEAVWLYCVFAELCENKAYSRKAAVLGRFFLSLPTLCTFLVFVPWTHQSHPSVFRFLAIHLIYLLTAYHLLAWHCCIYTMWRDYRDRDASQHRVLSLRTGSKGLPMILAIIPCHAEPVEVLLQTMRSLFASHYPPHLLHAFLAFDGYQNKQTFSEIVAFFGATISDGSIPVADATYRGARLTILIFDHSGKAGCQGRTISHIQCREEKYHTSAESVYVLFLDSDTNLNTHSMRSIVMRATRRGTDAVTPILGTTCSTSFSMLQDIDYLANDLYQHAVGSVCASVLCLHGAAFFVRFSVLLRISHEYFANWDKRESSLYKYWLHEYGDDRRMTKLLLSSGSGSAGLKIDTTEICETGAPRTLYGLLAQRRRWLLATIATDVHSGLSREMWLKTPTTQIFRLVYSSSRAYDTHGIFLGILIYYRDDSELSYLGRIIWIVFGIDWLFLLCFGILRRRYSPLLYPLYVALIPFFNFSCECYTLATLSRKTWGERQVSI